MDSEFAQTTDTAPAIPDSILSAATEAIATLPSQPSPSQHNRKGNPKELQPEQSEKGSTSAASVSPTAPVNPFALTDDREFSIEYRETPEVARTEERLRTAERASNLVIPVEPCQQATSVIANPGTAASPYRHCSCLGVMPGRACPSCLGSRWVKLCPKCEGTGRLDRTQRSGASRSEVCGGCMGRGEAPASLTEVRTIQADVAVAPTRAPLVAADSAADSDSDEVFRRAVRLPGIGVTSRKRRERVLPRGKAAAKKSQHR